MDFNDIPVFVRVVEAGSFTEAARVLGREKSSVSRSVSRLEEDLGVRLLQRTTRKLALTDAGQAFFDRVRGALSGVEEAASTIQELGGEPRGIVRMTAPADGDELGLAEIIAAFHTKYPEVHVELTLTSRHVDLVAEGFDLALRAGKLADSTLIVRKIGNSDVAAFAAPSYLERRGRPGTLADLTRHECLLYRARNGRALWSLAGPNGAESVEVTGPMSADNLHFVTRACAAGLGVALLPIAMAGRFVGGGALEHILPAYRFTGGIFAAVLPSSTFVPTRVALLRDFLVDHLTRSMAASQARCPGKKAQDQRRLRGNKLVKGGRPRRRRSH